MSAKILDYDKVCRTCLSQNNLQSIFVYKNDAQQLADIIMACASVQINENDGFPSNICLECAENVQKFFLFKKKCEEIDKMLRYGEENGLEKESTEMIVDEIKCESSEDDQDEETKENSRQIRKNHQKKCQSLKKIACSICGKEISARHVNSHMRTHTKEKPYECAECGQKFSLGGNLRRHMMTHTGERPHQCNICGKGFIQAVTLQTHLRVHTGETPYICYCCGKAFKQSKQCQIHIQKKHINPPSTSTLSPSLRKERRHVGLRRRPCTITENTVRPFACEICNRQFSKKIYLQTHTLRHNAEKSFLCSACGKGFVSKMGLETHSTVHTGDKPYTCHLCNKSFAHVGSLRIHNLKHTGEKPYSCTMCDKRFTQSTHLKTHLRLHEGIKPYKCSLCGKCFAQKGNLTIHVRTHTGETPFVCSYCDKGFYDSSSLRKHERGHK